MKVGNKSQAIALGVVAIGAVGFLLQTVFSSFGGSSQSAPVQEVIVKAPPASAVEKLPENEPGYEGSGETRISNAVFSRPLFGTGKESAKSEALPTTNSIEKPKRSSSGADQSEKASESPKPFDAGVPYTDRDALEGTLENPTKETKVSGQTDQKNEGVKVADTRPLVTYEGFVDAGNAIAIVRIGGSQYTVDVGDTLPHSTRVVAITPERLSLSVKGRIVSAWIGKEVRL